MNGLKQHAVWCEVARAHGCGALPLVARECGPRPCTVHAGAALQLWHAMNDEGSIADCQSDVASVGCTRSGPPWVYGRLGWPPWLRVHQCHMLPLFWDPSPSLSWRVPPPAEAPTCRARTFQESLQRGLETVQILGQGLLRFVVGGGEEGIRLAVWRPSEG